MNILVFPHVVLLPALDDRTAKLVSSISHSVEASPPQLSSYSLAVDVWHLLASHVTDKTYSNNKYFVIN